LAGGSRENVEPQRDFSVFAPAGRWTVATGEAKRNPWMFDVIPILHQMGQIYHASLQLGPQTAAAPSGLDSRTALARSSAALMCGQMFSRPTCRANSTWCISWAGCGLAPQRTKIRPAA